MFFIGIAGSFLPYLLLTGIMIVLTLGMNKSQDVLEANIEVKIIKTNYSNDQQHFADTNSFYFFDKQNKQTEKDVTQGICTTFQLHKESPPNIFSVFLPHNKKRPTPKSHSGLSPPVLVS